MLSDVAIVSTVISIGQTGVVRGLKEGEGRTGEGGTTGLVRRAGVLTKLGGQPGHTTGSTGEGKGENTEVEGEVGGTTSLMVSIRRSVQDG